LPELPEGGGNFSRLRADSPWSNRSTAHSTNRGRWSPSTSCSPIAANPVKGVKRPLANIQGFLLIQRI